VEAFVTVVTSMDGPDLLAVAKKRLAEAEVGGFDGAVRDNPSSAVGVAAGLGLIIGILIGRR
jgi:ElaB/YqjD/DUF883 family membrane-anchored ribosome-binding protein